MFFTLVLKLTLFFGRQDAKKMFSDDLFYPYGLFLKLTSSLVELTYYYKIVDKTNAKSALQFHSI